MDENNKVNIETIEQDMIIFLEHWKKRKKRIRFYRICLCGALFICSIAVGVWGYFHLYNQLPSVLRVKAGQMQVLDMKLPMTGKVITVSEGGESNIPKEEIVLDLNKEITLQMNENEKYRMDVKLFGCIPFKQVDIHVVNERELIPAGIPIGIYIETEGLMVIGVGDFEGKDGISYCPAKYALKSGDYILECNGIPVIDKDTFIHDIEESGGNNIVLKIKRGNEIQKIEVKPEKNRSGKYKIGVWVRDNAQGVGTMTYIDCDKRFGALGHGITDIDTSILMDVEDGTIYQTKIVAIKKGKVGTPGQMTGAIIYDDNQMLGDIEANSMEGIFGICNTDAMKICTQEPLPVGLKQEIKIGKAMIYCCLDEEPKYYNIEIIDVHMEHFNVNRGIEILVTDKELLEKTGGIVQGMSGSPIIQNGKIIGAVTHVLVNDPTRGYGIFIENMLEH